MHLLKLIWESGIYDQIVNKILGSTALCHQVTVNGENERKSSTTGGGRNRLFKKSKD